MQTTKHNTTPHHTTRHNIPATIIVTTDIPFTITGTKAMTHPGPGRRQITTTPIPDVCKKTVKKIGRLRVFVKRWQQEHLQLRRGWMGQKSTQGMSGSSCSWAIKCLCIGHSSHTPAHEKQAIRGREYY
uniref:Uncharacterized protein n=1 Tax=Eutreptiella gymnastica TaxID=73025 RepID=A0A7S4D224_9EUGL